LYLVLAGSSQLLAGIDLRGQVSLALARLITLQGLVQRLLGCSVGSLDREGLHHQIESYPTHRKIGPKQVRSYHVVFRARLIGEFFSFTSIGSFSTYCPINKKKPPTKKNSISHPLSKPLVPRFVLGFASSSFNPCVASLVAV